MSTESTKTIKGRISNKHGTEKFWILSVYKNLDDLSDANKHDNPFTPLPGELIIYDPDSDNGLPRYKIGDPDTREGGRRNVVELPFVDEGILEKIGELNTIVNGSSESIIGAWVFHDEINLNRLSYDEYRNLSFIANGNEYDTITKSSIGSSSWNINGLAYFNNDNAIADGIKYIHNPSGNYGINHGWENKADKTIYVTKETDSEYTAAWLRENADKIDGLQPKADLNLKTTDKTIVGAINEVNSNTVDKMVQLNLASGDNEIVSCDEQGIEWINTEYEIETNDGGYYHGFITNRMPICAGDNVEFEIDEESQVVKINAVDDSIVGTWVFNEIVDTSSLFEYSINFVSNGSTYTSISCHQDETDPITGVYYDSTYYYYYYDDNDKQWISQEARRIEITGGSDIDYPPFITWLKANAEKEALYQTKYDENLGTNSKYIVDAINEIHNSLGDISSLLAAAITQTEEIIGGTEE